MKLLKIILAFHHATKREYHCVTVNLSRRFEIYGADGIVDTDHTSAYLLFARCSRDLRTQNLGLHLGLELGLEKGVSLYELVFGAHKTHFHGLNMITKQSLLDCYQSRAS